jgi:hypothetical protein
MVRTFFDNDLSNSTHAQKPRRRVIVTADMSISVALHVCLSLSLLIAMSSMMGSGNT